MSAMQTQTQTEQPREQDPLLDLLDKWAPAPDKRRDPEHFSDLGLLENFWRGIELQVRTNGFAVASTRLVAGVFANAVDEAPTISILDQVAQAVAGVRATLDRENRKVVFRRAFPGLEDFTDGETWRRGSGSMQCELCSYMVQAHPMDLSAEFLHVLCNGERIKT